MKTDRDAMSIAVAALIQNKTLKKEFEKVEPQNEAQSERLQRKSRRNHDSITENLSDYDLRMLETKKAYDELHYLVSNFNKRLF
jgi:hypothetical protein